MIDRRILLKALAALPAAAAAQAERPNIILCMADDLGWGDPGFNGNRIIRTPHLHAMAEAGIRFTRFYSSLRRRLRWPVHAIGILSRSGRHVPEKG